MARNRQGPSVHIAGVTGSSPVPPTNKSAKNTMKHTGDAGSGATTMTWLPISSAPKDGTHILVRTTKFGPIVAHWDAMWGEWQSVPGHYSCKPTHFMPLPQPPEEMR